MMLEFKRRPSTLLRWWLTLVALVILAAFVYETRRTITWLSSDGRDYVFLQDGLVGWTWRYPVAQGQEPGWTRFQCGSYRDLYWWIVVRLDDPMPVIAVPLWMPFVLIVLPAAILWYRGRVIVRAKYSRLLQWLTPRRISRVGPGSYCICCILHACAVILALWIAWSSYKFFADRLLVSYSDRDSILILLGLTPLFGLGWTWLYVRWMNRLYFSQPIPLCRSCGYNLTGNESGRCSECGAAVVDDDVRRRPSVAD